MLLSIIIPCYNAEPYVDELIERLAYQTDNDVEIIIIDDGSRKPFEIKRECIGARVIRQDNKGVSAARNRGLDEAIGKYIAFIDADDLVSSGYLQTVKQKIAKNPDCIFLSWRTFGTGWDYRCELKEGDEFPGWNLCVWNRVYKKEIIGEIRFNEKKIVAEDAEFIREVKPNKIEYITDPIYFYRTTPHDSLTQRISKGKIDMRRIVYHFEHVTKDMDYLIEEMRKEYDDAEIILMTKQNDLPELKNYALIMEPSVVFGTELRGEKFAGFQQIPRPIKTQVVLYIGNAMEIGGVETWIYNFTAHLRSLYDIIVCYKDKMFPKQIERLSKNVLVHKLGTQPIFCETLLNMRITDKIPEQITAKKIVQLCHTCRIKEDWTIQKDFDRLVYVSETASRTFPNEGEVIHNLTYKEPHKKPLVLITASRFTFEKGLSRMYSLAERFKENGTEILWLVFTNANVDEINGIKRMEPTMNIRGWLQIADYLVQLSDSEAFCYSIAEALEEGTPVLTTPITVLKELGFRDKKDGYILPFDMQGINIAEIAENIPKPIYTNHNDEIIGKWREILGEPHPTGVYNLDKPFLKVRALEYFGDLELGRDVKAGEIVTMRQARAKMWLSLGKVEIINE